MLDWRAIDSKEALLTALKKRATEVPKGTWIVANLKNENMPQSKLPVAKELDQVAPDHPVHLRRGHISLANSIAMKLANVTTATPNPEGGGMERDANGEPIGWSREQLPRATIQVRISPGFDMHDDPEEGIATAIREIEGSGPCGLLR